MALPLLPIVAIAGGVYVVGRGLEAGGKAAVSAFKNRKGADVIIPDTAKAKASPDTAAPKASPDAAPKASPDAAPKASPSEPAEPSAEAAPAASPAPATADAEVQAGNSASVDDALAQAAQLETAVGELSEEFERVRSAFAARTANAARHARQMASLAAMAANSKDLDELVVIRQGIFDATEEAAVSWPEDAATFVDVAADTAQAVNLRIEEIGYTTKAAEPVATFKSKAEIKAEKAAAARAEKAAIRAEKRRAAGKPA